MSIWDSLKESFRKSSERKQRERDLMDQAKVEVEIERQKLFQEQYKINALEVAKSQAYREAAEKSGIQKLRALNRARRLNENNITPGSVFEKLSDYTKKNLAKREENLERTRVMREAAEEIKEKREEQRLQQRQDRMKTSPPGFRKPTWKM